MSDAPDFAGEQAPPSPSLGDRWFSLRNRILASQLFQRRAASSMFTRRIARNRARSLFDLVAGFVYSQVLLACVELDLFETLSRGPQSASVLARRFNLSIEATERLLAAAVSLQLVERRSHQRYGLGVLGATMVGNEAIAGMVRHHCALYADLADPVALLRGQAGSSHLANFWPYAGAQAPGALQEAQVSEYSSLMSDSQPLVAHEILDAYSFNKHRRLLDVGGGEGTFLVNLAAAVPNLDLVLFDLPAVAGRARLRFADAGLSKRAVAAGGDFLKDALPSGADVATLVRVVHDHDDARVLILLRAIGKALMPGGTLLIAEPMASTPGAEPMGDAYFGFYLLAMGRGKPRTFEQLSRLLKAAGFADVRLLGNRMPLQTQVLIAKKGAQ
jgi:demethylspheroidene O-methyltransferase